MDAGNGPDNLLLLKSNVLRSGKFAQLSGMVPLKVLFTRWLILKKSQSKAVSRNEQGICAELAYMLVKTGILPNEAGNKPLN
jgi:hypothetical protein